MFVPEFLFSSVPPAASGTKLEKKPPFAEFLHLHEPGQLGWGEGGASDDGISATQTHPTGELFQQAGDGAGGAGGGWLETHCGTVCSQEKLPHRLQTHLTLSGERTPLESEENATQTLGIWIINDI